ncbi:hypothetical protein BV22DRAFT_1191146 [Leucogyrophana mollusca]|uniref:Uncharacterized protein n=1 Tax=Leucogyrophana mollusca TaxID=85980 RepID=A0ACB8BXY8_9AGAM|nr:hypothetical protein BV22DRAFT_1191146 [Leucogyrophana mollusca]
MSEGHMNVLFDLWAATLAKHDEGPPFADHKDLYNIIDSTRVGNVNWQGFTVQYQGERPDEDVPPWMNGEYDVWFRDPHEVVRNMLANPDYATEIDYTPYREYSTADDKRQWKDFMSGDWAWQQADEIALDPSTHGATFVPVILGSDKTTVSVGTGHNQYYPLYASIGNVHNSVRRAHRDALAVIGFLAIPKTNRQYTNDDDFRTFRRHLFHSSLSHILRSLTPAMTQPEIVRFGDGHFRRVVYGLGPYIADYEEQAILAAIVRNWCPKCLALRTNLDGDALLRCRKHIDALVEELDPGTLWDEYGVIGDVVPFTNDFPRADIHELLAPDLLHQLIKGALRTISSTGLKTEIMSDIDRRVAAVASFTNLRRFPEGRGFQQWTGNDSKALMKVYLPAIEGHVPEDVVRTFRAFLEFCYLVRRNIITEDTLDQIEDALRRFYHFRDIFKTTGVVFSFSLPRQHSMKHYALMIRLFGAPNGLCSSITESKHIKAVKEPWRRSSRNKPLGQMLKTNQRLDNLAASRDDFESRGMLRGTCLGEVIKALAATDAAGQDANTRPDEHLTRPIILPDNEYDEGDIIDGPTTEANVKLARTPQRTRARTVPELAEEINVPHLRRLIRYFLFSQLHPNDPRDPILVPPTSCPRHNGKVSVFNSAAATFFAPSDPSGIGGMRREHIRACPLWRREHARNDCVFVNTDPDLQGMPGLDIARILAFFSFKFEGAVYPCAVIHWFEKVDDKADEDTGMWVVQPGFGEGGKREVAVIHIDTIYRAAHLIPVYGPDFIPADILFHQSYDVFRSFYVNNFGGTDDQYHYNDTWAFDVNTKQWSELQCIGFIPSPRERHAAAAVDDVVYVFGGRGVDGKDLGDLAAFKVSDQRWFMFPNMGPAPSGRSGHAMASVGNRVFVLGGEPAPTGGYGDDNINVLNTEHIQYPSSGPAPVAPPAIPELTQGAKSSVALQEDDYVSKQGRDTANDHAEELRRMKDELDKQQEENSNLRVERGLLLQMVHERRSERGRIEMLEGELFQATKEATHLEVLKRELAATQEVLELSRRVSAARQAEVEELKREIGRLNAVLEVYQEHPPTDNRGVGHYTPGPSSSTNYWQESPVDRDTTSPVPSYHTYEFSSG